MLSLAHHLQSAISRGLAAERPPRRTGSGSVTRARVTRPFDQLLLATGGRQVVRALEAIGGAEPISERAMRAVAYAGSWVDRRAMWAALTE